MSTPIPALQSSEFEWGDVSRRRQRRYRSGLGHGQMKCRRPNACTPHVNGQLNQFGETSVSSIDGVDSVDSVAEDEVRADESTEKSVRAAGSRQTKSEQTAKSRRIHGADKTRADESTEDGASVAGSSQNVVRHPVNSGRTLWIQLFSEEDEEESVPRGKRRCTRHLFPRRPTQLLHPASA
ncbi:hypothetical protein HPB51_001516 [Rhipicephalus microplus]|uniref:Uncharacterized protein n=1 Tax=Rhipicephalus microplus TaxID=6941 RepID=A0A9J6EVP3_RHIMP|nr:hypothetical protein HPB51_001516 [Rhipicephalus microplus]